MERGDFLGGAGGGERGGKRLRIDLREKSG